MKLSKQGAKLHGEAESLLSLSRTLTDEESEFVYNNWHPGAEHIVTVGGQFFTPTAIASELSLLCRQDGRIVDLAAGIGVLGWHISQLYPRGRANIIAIELCAEFIDVGKRVFPEATWIHGDIFDKALWEEIGIVDGMVSNPPFGSVPMTKGKGEWLSYNGPAHLMACELAIRFSETGGTFILPASDLPFEYSDYSAKVSRYGSGHRHKPGSQYTRNLQRLFNAYPDIILGGIGTDLSIYQNEWRDVAPEVELVDVDHEDSACGFGFGTPERPGLL